MALEKQIRSEVLFMFGFGKKRSADKACTGGVAIKTLGKDDRISVMSDEIHIYADKRDRTYHVSEVIKIAIYTTDQGPAADDMALLMVMADGLFILPSEHPLYETFLFDGLAGKIPLDFPKIIDASSSTENAEFILFEKEIFPSK